MHHNVIILFILFIIQGYLADSGFVEMGRVQKILQGTIDNNFLDTFYVECRVM